MDNASDKNPEDLLREIAENGISQSVCINDLGMCLLLPLWGFHRSWEVDSALLVKIVSHTYHCKWFEISIVFKLHVNQI